MAVTLPVIAIIGRPNVGKSTLFNRLAGGRRIAIVSDIPGTTRDRVSIDASYGRLRFALIDTGGIDDGVTDTMNRAVQEQTASAIAEADVLILVTDAVDGITAGDRDAAQIARRSGKPVVLAVNKADSQKRAMLAVDFYELAMGEPIPISAYHDQGITELMESVAAVLPEPVESPDSDLYPRVAIAGRTNVGKSALMNAIAGQTRSIVSAVPGTTRDPVDSLLRFKDRDLQFIDTAGLRRRGRIEGGIEKYSSLRTLQAIERCHVAILVLDATEFVTAQDTHVAGFIDQAGRAAVIALNKWDLAPETGVEHDAAMLEIRQRLKFLVSSPIRLVSALHGRGIPGLLESVVATYDQFTRTIEENALRKVISDAIAAHPPPSQGRNDVRLRKISQRRSSPPTFVFHTGDPARIHFTYRRYLENSLRNAFGFEGTPLKLEFVADR